MKKLPPVLLCILAFACTSTPKEAPPQVKIMTESIIPFTVTDSFPHDTTSFTEGLLVYDGQLFESTGHTDSYPVSRSLFGVVDKKTGRINVGSEIKDPKYFGEGIVILKDKIYQLTDTNRVGFVYDAKTYRRLSEFHYAGDGWAFTTNGTSLIMSSGSSSVLYRDPLSFRTVKVLSVTSPDGTPVGNINELEMINGYLYANQWLTNYILKIDTASGRIVGKLDLSPLKNAAMAKYPRAAETNGIAYDSALNRIYVTGKLWPTIYEIKFDH
ncbi:MAG TPA: glutaminyl-peptide cyclotransferase [Puia sp.]|jgi:glutamine cyclotransferase